MAKDSKGRPLQKHTLNLFEGDWDRLASLIPAAEPSVIIRSLVRDTIARLEGEVPNVKVELGGDPLSKRD